MKWFKHFSKAHEDRAVETIINEFGAAGYGLYFYCLEIIVGDIDAEQVTFELEPDAPILAKRLGLDTILAEKIMLRCIELGLFELSDNGRLTCLKIGKYLEKSATSNLGMRAIIEKSKEVRQEKSGLVRISQDVPDQIKIKKRLRRDIDKENQEEKKADKPPIPLEAKTLAYLLYTLHEEKIDHGKKCPSVSTLRSWAIDIERLNRLDGRSWEDIEKVIRWVKVPGQFWAPNIQSGSKLREKFDTVFAQMKQGGQRIAARVESRGASLDLKE